LKDKKIMKSACYLVGIVQLQIMSCFFVFNIAGSESLAKSQNTKVRDYFFSEELDLPSFKNQTIFQTLQFVENGLQTKDGEESYKKAIALGKSSLKTISRGYHDELFSLIGLAEELSGDLNLALDAYNSSLLLRSNNASVLYRIANIYKQQNQCDKTISLAQEVLWRAKSEQERIELLLGECLISTNRLAALKHFETAIAKSPSYLPALKQVIQIYEEQIKEEIDPIKRTEIEAKIANNLSLICKLKPDDRVSALRFAGFLFSRSDPLLNSQKLKEAEQIAESYSKNSRYKDSDFVKLLFDIQLKQGRVESAERTLESGLKAAPKALALANAKKQLEIQKKALESPLNTD
jgi:tetratricopeptide (TPR) repeat protein